LRNSFSTIFAAQSPHRLIGYFLRKFSGLAFAQAATGAVITLLSFAVPEASSRILGIYIPAKDYSGAVKLLALALGAVALLQCFQLLQQRLASAVSSRLTCILQRYTLRRCLALPMQWHLLHGPAAANRSFFYDISNLTSLASNVIGMAIFPFVQITLVLGVMLYLNHILALISLMPLCIMATISWISIRKLPSAAASEIREANMLGRVFFDFVSCVRLVKALCIEPAAARDARPQIESASNANRELANLNALFGSMTSLTVSIGGLLVMGAGLALLAKQLLSLTDLLRFIFFAALLYQPFERLSHFGQIYLQANESWRNMRSNLSGARTEKSERRTKTRFLRCGDIVAENLCFAYDGHPILKSVNLVASEGEVVGIVGRSGGGKTTLLSILSGYLEPDEGSVRIGKEYLKDLSRQALREQVFYAGQEAMLFNRSIRFNLLMARARASESMMWEALENAGMREAVASFPNQLDHTVGDHGTMLSGGERQRLLVAMAWLRNPRVLLLDEITAALDAITDQQVRECIRRLMTGRTTIIVSHRLENLAAANRIYVLESGEVLDEGTHAALLSECSLYQQLWEARSL
jgi:ABC-type bacteriocin/lantibiotic exporter with double-glycine peptidase domain